MRGVKTRHDCDERGSVIVAVSIVMILMVLSTTVAARTLSALVSVRHDQDFAASLAQADAGLSDAMFRIDQFGVNDTASFCVGGDIKCSPNFVPGAATAAYKAIKVDSNTFAVTALGRVNNRPHAIQATVARSALFPFAIFGNGDVTFNGNGTGTIRATLPDGSFDPNRLADVGSNATVTCHSGAQEGDQQVSYKDSWNGCPTPISGTGTYLPKDPVTSANCPSPNTNVPPVPCLPASVPTPNCPLFNTFSGVISGTYYCTGNVTFDSSSPLTVDGLFKLFVIPAGGTADINFASTTINKGGDPTKFAVYLAGAGNLNMGNGAHAADITGTIWAPSANVTSNGCKMALTGALVIGTYTCNGGPNLTVNYDSRLQSLLSQDWGVRNYSEIPSSQFTLPGF